MKNIEGKQVWVIPCPWDEQDLPVSQCLGCPDGGEGSVVYDGLKPIVSCRYDEWKKETEEGGES